MIETLFIESRAFSIYKDNLIKLSNGEMSEYYVDNRIFYGYCNYMNDIVQQLVTLSDFYDFDMIAGIDSGGVPWAVRVAQLTNKPFLVVRKSKKEYGLSKSIEGHFTEGLKILLMEDHISSGNSVRNAIEKCKENNLMPIGVISISCKEELKYINHKTLTTINKLITQYEFIHNKE